MIRFLHTGDWQLGMTRHFFSEGVQERFAQSRFDAIRRLGQIAKEENCDFMVVCGDIFEFNFVDQKTVVRACEALKDVSVPVYLLPGNHDPLNAASVFRNEMFLDKKPQNVHVIEDSQPVKVKGSEGEDIQLFGLPWTSKEPGYDMVARMLEELEPVADITRVCVAHGMVDTLSPDPDEPALIALDAMETAIARNKAHYFALGDRHSLTNVGNTGRIWYAGTPEPTRYTETMPGFTLVVTIDENEVSTREVKVGKWKFIERKDLYLNTKEDVDSLRDWLENIEDKERTVLKLRFTGSLSLSLHSELEEMLKYFRNIFGAIETRVDDLVIMPEDGDFTELGFSGFADATVRRLRDSINEEGRDSTRARDALALLVRLVGRKK